METVKTDNLEQLEARLRKGIEEAKAAGYKIERGIFLMSNPDKCCCAIGACKATDPEAPKLDGLFVSVVGYAAARLGLQMDETSAFIDGFDGVKPSHACRTRLQPYYALGEKLAKEYVGC